MNRREIRPELPKHGYGCGLIINKCAAFATRGNFAAQNDRGFFPIEAVVLENFADCSLAITLAFENC